MTCGTVVPVVEEIHVGDEGSIFLATFKDWDPLAEIWRVLDISNQTTLQFKFRKPGGTMVTETAAYAGGNYGNGTGTDGRALFTVPVAAPDAWLDRAGWWWVRGYIETPAGKWHTSKYEFEVYPIDE